MEEPNKMRVYRKHDGGERVRVREDENNKRANKAFDERVRLKENKIAHEKISEEKGLKFNSSVRAFTANGVEEGTIEDFDETGLVWVRFGDTIREDKTYKDIRLIKPIDIELKN